MMRSYDTRTGASLSGTRRAALEDEVRVAHPVSPNAASARAPSRSRSRRFTAGHDNRVEKGRVQEEQQAQEAQEVQGVQGVRTTTFDGRDFGGAVA